MLRRLFTALRPVARLSAPLGRVVAGRRFLTVWAMVEYRGRRSGRRYRTPLAVHRTTDGFVFPVAFGRGTQWPANVVAAGGCRMRWNGRMFDATDPEIVGANVGSNGSSSYTAGRSYAIQRATQAANAGMTIHAVGVGADADMDLLNEIVQIGHGSAFHATGSIDDYREQLREAFRTLGGDRQSILIR